MDMQWTNDIATWEVKHADSLLCSLRAHKEPLPADLAVLRERLSIARDELAFHLERGNAHRVQTETPVLREILRAHWRKNGFPLA